MRPTFSLSRWTTKATSSPVDDLAGLPTLAVQHAEILNCKTSSSCKRTTVPDQAGDTTPDAPSRQDHLLARTGQTHPLVERLHLGHGRLSETTDRWLGGEIERAVSAFESSCIFCPYGDPTQVLSNREAERTSSFDFCQP